MADEFQDEQILKMASAFKKLRGCDPKAATCRGKLQSRRSKINLEITKQTMMRNGAEKLYKATTSKKLRETVALELSFLNSNLQLLQEQLAELNSSMHMYQEECADSLPMIPLGLKETKDLDMTQAMMTFITEHYGESGDSYEAAIREYHEYREASRRPTRNLEGVQLLCEYYNLLHYVDRRFFPPGRALPGIYFQWYDALTGLPATQKTVAFEKASILFNVAALYTQVGAKQNRSSVTTTITPNDDDDKDDDSDTTKQHNNNDGKNGTETETGSNNNNRTRNNNKATSGNVSGSDSAVDAFLRAAAMLAYVRDHFSHAPSADLRSDTLQALATLMVAQARECLFDRIASEEEGGVFRKRMLEASTGCGKEAVKEFIGVVEIAQEAAEVADAYSHVHENMLLPLKEYLPSAWCGLVALKAERYRALAHYYAAVGLLSYKGELDETVKRTIEFLHLAPSGGGMESHNDSVTSNTSNIPVPQTERECFRLGKAHLRQALLRHEEALRLHRMQTRDLRGISDQLERRLKRDHQIASDFYADLEEEDDFEEVQEAPQVQASTKYQLTLISPDLSLYKVPDPFRALGPVSVFSARHEWSPPRTCNLTKKRRRSTGSDSASTSFGFSIKGDSPVQVAAVEHCSLAHLAGLRGGDYIVGIGDTDTKWYTHDRVVDLIRTTGDTLTLRVVSPMPSPANGITSAHQHGSGASIAPTSGSASAPQSYSRNSPNTSSPTGSLGSSGSRGKATSSGRSKTWTTFFYRRSSGRDSSASPS